MGKEIKIRIGVILIIFVLDVFIYLFYIKDEKSYYSNEKINLTNSTIPNKPNEVIHQLDSYDYYGYIKKDLVKDININEIDCAGNQIDMKVSSNKQQVLLDYICAIGKEQNLKISELSPIESSKDGYNMRIKILFKR
ncbi:hypothetical protein IAI10_07985 [Clostridium sp. 19966]|uniref:hypothetical protein n=1 Tax=Clostridium sp. 19966 TaxID=2768166 RepID=UPI0028DFC7E3|nr:hypothetical protein [Clostridium sp. 19966]MDT8716593.1 hypothetical protein [Clostridium sp. 19966]